METLVWNCLVCGHDILPELGMEDPTESWFTKAVAVLRDGRIINGSFNVLGMAGSELFYDGQGSKPSVYHEFCYRNSGSPKEYAGPSEASLLNEYNQGFFMTKILNELKSDVYDKVLAKLEKTEDPQKLAQTDRRINGLGTEIETFNLLEIYVKQLCGFEFKFGNEEILLTQSEIARHYAVANARSVGHSDRLHPEIKANYLEMEKSHLKIAEVLENAALEIKAIKEEINRQAQLINSAPKPKHSHAQAEQSIAEAVREKGWVVMGITGEIPFAYTIGLYKNFKHPEIVVTAIDAHQASSLLNLLGEQIREGKRFETGKVYGKGEGMHRHVFLKVENKHRNEYFGKAIGFYNGLHFPVIQRVTADKQEIFPWEDGCDPVLKHAQKILGKAELIDDDL